MSRSSSDEEELLLLLAVSTVGRRKRKWVHEINKKREECGEFHRLCRELSSFEDRFFTYFRMSQEQFEHLHALLEPKITKSVTNWRKPIPTKERLAICLRYLATGDSHPPAFSFRVGRTTVSSIVKQVCMEMWNVIQSVYLPNPTEEVWRKSEVRFRERWNYPNCIGSIDGKHVRIKCPNKSGSNYFCYKNYFSIVLLAIVDPYYNFTVVDIDSYGRHSDSAIFQNSSFYRDYVNKKILLPPKPLPGTNTPVPHVFIGDEGFKLETYLMRPFPRNTVVENAEKLTYNKRHCRARRVVENAFGILAQKWRIFFRPIESGVNTAVHIVKAACCLHNYVRKDHMATENDREVDEGASNPLTNAFLTTAPLRERSSDAAQAVRNHFVRYFYNQANA